MGSLLKRYREPLFVVGLLVASFLAFFVHAKKGAGLNALDRFLISCMAPVERTITAAAFGTIDAFRGYVALRSVREQNLDLRRKNLVARQLDQQNAELRLENERLRRLLDFEDKQAPRRLLVAPVVAVGASPHSHSLRIARGSDDGVLKGAPVIAPEGIVGTVTQVTGSYADVQLIISPLSAVPAVTQRTRSRSTVKGTGDIQRCTLEYAPRADDLQDGDVLVTAGGPDFFPAGLRVGVAINVSRKPHGLFLDAEVKPAVDFSRLDEVEVIVAQLPQANDAVPVRERAVTLRVALVLVVCFALAVIESVTPFLLHLRASRPDLLLVVVLYLALHDDVIQGAALSAAAGYFSDLTSATPAFLYTFLAVLTFVVLRIAGAGLKTEGGAQSAAVAFGASIVHAIIAAAVFGFFTGTGVHFAPVPMLWSAVGTALAAPLVFFLLRRLDSNFVHAEESGGLR